MAKRNGGIIGPSNVPTGQYGGTASGVWRLRDAFNYIKAGLWPGFATYPVGNSLRFNSGSSDNLSRTPASASNRKTWTWSGWVKRSTLGTQQPLFYNSDGATSNGHGGIYIESDNTVWFAGTSDGASYSNAINTNAVLRDVSAWYHIVVVCDTTNATQANRQLIYINSVLQTVTVTQAITLNADLQINRNTQTNIGAIGYTGGTSYLNGYLAEVNFVDGQALTPSSFGQTDSATGIWTPKPYYGTFGTNGFFLKFANSAALGTDSSGNGNTWTANNLTSIDQTTDTPTNNFATINTLTCNDTGTLTSADGNLTITGGNDMGATIGISKGKWYWESKRTNSTGAAHWGIGFTQSWNSSTQIVTGNGSGIWIRNDFTGGYNVSNSGSNGFTSISGSTTGSSIANGDIVGIALDLDSATKSITFYQNGSSVGSGTFSYDGTTTFCTPFVRNNSGVQSQWNFGNPPFTISSGNADADGFGNFEYAVPSGYYALCTKNLATYG
jgi:hypothetical protein